MKKKSPKPIIDSRYLKILSAKKSELKDSITFICLDEEKYGAYDVVELTKVAETIEKIEPSGCYVVGLKKLRVNIFDRKEIKNRDIIITVSQQDSGMSERDIEEHFMVAFEDAKSIKFVHQCAEKIE